MFFEFLRRQRRGLVVALLALITVGSMTSRDEEAVGAERGPLVAEWTRAGTYWTLAGVHASLAWTGDLLGGFAGDDRSAEVERLRQEVARLEEEKTRLIGVLQENARLRELVGFQRNHPEFEVVPARVIGRDTTPYFRVLKLHIKSSVKLKPRMPVVSGEGVVGQIHQVQGHYADVITVSDPRSRIDAVNQRNRAPGIVRGLGHERDYLAEVAYLDQRDRVRAGDLMVTGGMDDVFPPELILGRIHEVERAERQLFQEVLLEPSVDFSRLREVFVIVGSD